MESDIKRQHRLALCPWPSALYPTCQYINLKGWSSRLSRLYWTYHYVVGSNKNGKNNKPELHVIWLDLENAYSSVRHQLLEKAMEFFWIPEDIKNLISTYFKRTYVRVSNNKYSTNWQKLNIGIMMGCVISQLLFVLVMEMILRSADVNTNQITGPSMKPFMDVVTLIAESRSHMEQLVTRLQELFKWAAMKIKSSKCQSLSLLKGNCKEIKFSVDENEIPPIHEKSVKNLGRVLFPTTYWSTSLAGPQKTVTRWITLHW